MRRDQPTTPFDVEADDLTQEFWGASKGWVSSEQPTVRRRAERSARTTDDTTGSLRVIRDGFAAFRPQTAIGATGEVARQRRHGVPSHTESVPVVHDRRREATLGELAAGRSDVGGWFDDDDFDDIPLPVTAGRGRTAAAPAPRSDRRDDRGFDDSEYDDPEYDVPLTPVHPLAERLGLGAVDPLLLRAGALVLALILLVPFALSLRPDRAESLPGDVVETPQPVVAGAAPAATEAQVTVDTESATVAAAAPAAVPAAQPQSVSTEAAPAETIVVQNASPSTAPAVASSTVDDEAATVDVAAERVVPFCPQTYTAGAGDSWYRIADEAGVTPKALLAENNATTASVILPGDDICLPDGASMPTPPTTVAPASTAPTAGDAPTTTEAPSTTSPTTTVAPVAALSRTQVQDLIRETWPEEEVEKALAIARRESNYIATADNGSCCVGVFQIYWTVHRGWLDDFGITQRSDLFDARKNIAAAFHMWEQSGWGPWGG